ncbi:MAG TPA: bifunctional [glutamine synthetase] adenylyltransferase/[glutamine synthetase]-adenylyl-L-tyrosine phosphorylase [Acidimicrobiales bacterium]|nr:bifunctional [glutamine synthetase] adenylyltransferase/[glutamine synthetase]-adenylyl-L-tyrosine phosphorylase [Acidimicrobiales bacterium]
MALPEAVDAAAARSARPAAVRAALEWLLASYPDLGDELVAGGTLLTTVVAVLGASPALGRLLQSDPVALEVLRELDIPVALPTLPSDPAAGDGPGELAAWSRRELLRIAARDLTGLDALEPVGRNLAAMADGVLTGARALAEGSAEGLAIVAMGKAGACELNYASDVDLLLAGEGDPRPMLDIARLCFRVDLNLRPEGRDGPLVRSLDSYRAYWQSWAQAWERQALLKARPVAGPPELCAAFAEAAAELVWGERLGPDDVRELRRMKMRAEADVARRGLSAREIKRGPGGIRDVEFSVQLLQLIHGHDDEALRLPATLPALRELSRAGYVAHDDASTLESAYRFLRAVENRLQLAEGQQTHVVPADPDARHWLGRVLGLLDDPAASAAERFDGELRRWQAMARAVHQRLFFRPLLEAFTGKLGQPPLEPQLSLEAAGERLAAFGFADTERARTALVELTRGMTRSSRLMQSLLPLMLEWQSLTPDPDLGLLGLRRLAAAPAARRDAIAAFRDSPEVARRVCTLLGTTPLVHEPLRRDPALIARLAAADGLAPRSRLDLLEQADETISWRNDTTQRQQAMSRLKSAEEAVVIAADVLGEADVDDVGRRLAELAEAVLAASLRAVGPRTSLAVIGMGRLGGSELSYASDLDLLLVLASPDGGPPSAAEAALGEGDAERLLRFVNGETPARRIYTLDLRLRPEGRHGVLARSLEGYATYYRSRAGVWERQALLRARPVAGDATLAAAFIELARTVTLGEALTDDEMREIRRMKARIETERVPAGEDPEFHLKLGPGSISDVEWTTQLLQLRHRVPGTVTLAALDALVDAGAIEGGDAAALADSYRYCELLRNRLHLVQATTSDALPSAPDKLAVLARSLGAHPSELRERYRQLTRRARRVTERLFYGQQPAGHRQ